jgi:hypothetical protein
MKTYTKGPWRIEKCQCGHPSCSKYGLSNGMFYQGSGFTLEDATLAAASPKLLEALEGLLAVVEVRIDDPRIAQFDAARAAVKLAKVQL